MATSELSKQLGKALQKARKQAGFKSAKAFAETCGLPYGTYVDYEQGRHDIPLDNAILFADTLGLSLDELAGRPKPEPEPVPKPNTPPDERQLLASYRSMTNDGKSALLASATGMAAVFPETESADRRSA